MQRHSLLGNASLVAAVAGAAAMEAARRAGPLAGQSWVEVAAAGFEAAVVGGLADWFAVTALFRHPLGLPIPHTAIIPARRAKIIDGIVSMVEREWLSPDVIGARLARISPSGAVTDWLAGADHVRRLADPLRDLLRVLSRILTEPQVERLAGRALRDGLRDLQGGEAAGRWLQQATRGPGAAAAFETAALSLANLLRRPDTAERLQLWLDRSARELRRTGGRLLPLILGRRIVQRKIVEAAGEYATAELERAAADPGHPLRDFVFGGVRHFAERLAAGDPEANSQVAHLQGALADSLDSGPLVRHVLGRLQGRLDRDLADPQGYLAGLVDRELQQGILALLSDPGRARAFDGWVRATADELLRRHHHQIGLTVRENLEALDTSTLVAQIEERIGGDLQFIRLNGALVGGLIGVALALVHRLAG